MITEVSIYEDGILYGLLLEPTGDNYEYPTLNVLKIKSTVEPSQYGTRKTPFEFGLWPGNVVGLLMGVSY